MSELCSTAPSLQRTIIIWVVMIITAAIFVMADFSKLLNPNKWSSRSMALAYRFGL
jgi:hypothetical protein